jgi:amino-acid N-acetyltransferase
MNTTARSSVRMAVSNDFDSVTKLLQSENLPVEDIPASLPHFFVIEDRGEIIAAVGLEIYGQDGLLRSMVVKPSYRNQSLAATLLDNLLLFAADKGIVDIYLVTTTAENYFSKKKFFVVQRSDVPLPIGSTQEFSTLCPSTAAVMMRKIS